jgi:(p)ppGpp synthase/HD superfamily hydrolase
MMNAGTLTARFDDALVYTSHVHGGHVRKATSVPYIAHLLGIAPLVLEDGGDEDEVIAALLHDAPEDRGGRERLNDIRARFGNHVAHIIDGCTDTYETNKPPYVVRKREHMHRLRSASPDVLRVTAADKLNNARAILADFRKPEPGPKVFELFTQKKTGTLWYYACAVNVLRDHFPGSLAAELERVVRELRDLSAPNLSWPKNETEDPIPAD